MMKRGSLGVVFSAVCALGLAAGLGTGGCSNQSADCQSTYDYFATQVWPIIGTKCIACHNPQGLAKDTSYVLKGTAEAGFLEYNLDMFSNVASFQKDGVSQVLLKPTLTIDHRGGHVIDKDGPEYQVLEGFVKLIDKGNTCQPKPTAHFTGVEELDNVGTLRKSALILAGRLPTAAEIAQVQGGDDAALEAVLAKYMTEEPFYDFLRRTYNDLFLTDFYLDNNASGVIGDQKYAHPDWPNTASKDLLTQYGLADVDELRRYTDLALAREPLELVTHVVREHRPFTEILTADYFMVSPLSAKTYGVNASFKNPNNPLEFAEAKLKDIPHAGVLTSPIMLSRHPTTPTNRNRARSRKVYLWFLGTNILLTAERPVDQTKVKSINPTRDDEHCTVCHANVDPIAGCFQAFDERGVYDDTPTWYPEMFPPGFGKSLLPLASAKTGLQWLSQQVTKDPRFALSTVFTIYHGLTGRDQLIAPSDTSDPQYQDKFASYLAQADTFRHIADAFVASNYDLRVVVAKLVQTPYFRAVNSVELDDSRRIRLAEVGRSQLLAPELLHQKITAILGIPWSVNGNRPELAAEQRNPARLGQYQLFYGGIDSDAVTKRMNDPNGIMAAVAERMALQMACRAVPYDFTRVNDKRLLFPSVQIGATSLDPMNLEPETEAGVPIELNQQAIRQTMVYLHQRLLGQTYAPDDPEIDRTFNVYVAAWRDGIKGMKAAKPTVSEQLNYDCRADSDYWTGTPLAMNRQVTDDKRFVIRSWMAAMTYLLSDYNFLYE